MTAPLNVVYALHAHTWSDGWSGHSCNLPAGHDGIVCRCRCDATIRNPDQIPEQRAS